MGKIKKIETRKLFRGRRGVLTQQNSLRIGVMKEGFEENKKITLPLSYNYSNDNSGGEYRCYSYNEKGMGFSATVQNLRVIKNLVQAGEQKLFTLNTQS